MNSDGRSARTAEPPSFSEAYSLAMIEASPLGLLISDAEGRCVYANAAYWHLSGLTAEELCGEPWITAIHPEDRQSARRAWPGSTAARAPSHQASSWHEVRLLRPDGRVRWVRLHIAALCDDGSANTQYVHTLDDVTARREAEDALCAANKSLLDQNTRAQVTLDSIGDAVVTIDRPGNVTYLNRVAETFTGWSHEDAVGRPLEDIFNVVDAETRRRAINPAQRAIHEGQAVELAVGCVLLRPDGTELAIEDSAAPIHNEHGGISGAVIVFHEAARSRAVAERMAYMAQHDSLTGLPNRALLRELLGQAIGLARRHGKAVGVLYIDLDNFKHVNDSLGHESGDQLLRAAAERLRSCVRAADSVCREGGDEFVILLSELEHAGDAGSVAGKVHALFEMPLLVDGREYHVTTSVGISLFPDDGDSVDALLRRADEAMYQAKADGRGMSHCLSADTNTKGGRRGPLGPAPAP